MDFNPSGKLPGCIYSQERHMERLGVNGVESILVYSRALHFVLITAEGNSWKGLWAATTCCFYPEAVTSSSTVFTDQQQVCFHSVITLWLCCRSPFLSDWLLFEGFVLISCCSSCWISVILVGCVAVWTVHWSDFSTWLLVLILR